ncbi:MAG: L-dopachrome tautomerase-related protein [Acidobacteriaceae bacterium]
MIQRLRSPLALFAPLLFAAVPVFAQDQSSLTANPPSTPSDHTFGNLETVATFSGPMPTGVTVSRGNRIFVNFPRWGDDVPFTVAELVHGHAVPYPSPEINDWPGRNLPNPNAFADEPANQTHLVNVQSVVVDPADRLWLLDTGAPRLKNIVPGGPKLVCVDLATNKVVRTILLPPETAGANSYMNDIRFDLTVGDSGPQDPQTMPGSKPAPDPHKPAPDPSHPVAERSPGQHSGSNINIHGTAYITDSASEGPNAIIVVDLATGKSFRRLNQHISVLGEPGFLMFAEGRPVYQTEPNHPPKPVLFAADGIAISADGKELYYCPISSTKLYAVSTDMLRDRSKSDGQVEATVRIATGKMPSDGLESDSSGNVYLSDPVTDSIHRWSPSTGLTETLVHDPRLLWPDTMSLAGDGYLYVTANQLNRQPTMHNGKDLRIKPYTLFRLQVNAKPVRLGQ